MSTIYIAAISSTDIETVLARVRAELLANLGASIIIIKPTTTSLDASSNSGFINASETTSESSNSYVTTMTETSASTGSPNEPNDSQTSDLSIASNNERHFESDDEGEVFERSYSKWFVPCNAKRDDNRRMGPFFRQRRPQYDPYLLYSSESRVNIPSISFYRTINSQKFMCSLNFEDTPTRKANPEHRVLLLEILDYFNITWSQDVNIWNIASCKRWLFPPNTHYVPSTKFYQGNSKCLAAVCPQELWPEIKNKYVYEWPSKQYMKFVKSIEKNPRKYFRAKGKRLTEENCGINGYEGECVEIGQHFYDTN